MKPRHRDSVVWLECRATNSERNERVFWVFWFLSLVLCPVALGWFFVRNNQVYRFRMDLVDLVYQRNLEDIDAGCWDASVLHARWAEFRRVSYNQMIFSLKRLEPESFWDNVWFLRPSDGVSS